MNGWCDRSLGRGGTRLVLNIIIGCCIFWGSCEASAQPRAIAKNSIYFELLGNGFFYSINYERAFNQSLRARIGFMSGQFAYEAICSLIHCGQDDEDRFNLIPLMLNYTHGQGQHKFETGLGLAFTLSSKGEFDFDFNDVIIIDQTTKLVGAATIGYRFQPENRGMVFRAGFTPLFSDKGVLPWGGLTVGYAW